MSPGSWALKAKAQAANTNCSERSNSQGDSLVGGCDGNVTRALATLERLNGLSPEGGPPLT